MSHLYHKGAKLKASRPDSDKVHSITINTQLDISMATRAKAIAKALLGVKGFFRTGIIHYKSLSPLYRVTIDGGHDDAICAEEFMFLSDGNVSSGESFSDIMKSVKQGKPVSLT